MSLSTILTALRLALALFLTFLSIACSSDGGAGAAKGAPGGGAHASSGASSQVGGASSTASSGSSAGASGTVADAGTLPGVDASVTALAFYVAPDGDDGNPGTLAQPFATLSRAQLAMRASSTVKTTYVRAGTYTPAAVQGSCAWGSSAGTSLELTAADTGETWSYYPPDGEGSAVVDGKSTAGTSADAGTGNGTGCGISISGAENVTLAGLAFQNFLWSGVWAFQAKNLVIRDTTVHHVTGVLFGSASIFVAASPGATIANNLVFDGAYHGILIVDNSMTGGTTSDTLVASNAVIDSCKWPAVSGGGNDQNGGDCGALYFWSQVPSTSTNVRFIGNYVRDVNVSSNGAGDFGACCTIGIYLDDGANDVTVSGNVVTGVASACFLIHGGSNNQITGNLCDLGASGREEIVHYQTDSLTTRMAGNVFEHNVVVAGSPDASPGFVGSLNPPTPLTIQNNAYFNYAGARVNSTGTGGAGSDTSPTYVDPGLSCWAPVVAGSSAVLGPPVQFRALAGGWGPVGFVLPKTGTAPSWPHPC